MQRSSIAASCAFAFAVFFGGVAPANYDPHAPSIFTPRVVAPVGPEAAPAARKAAPAAPERAINDPVPAEQQSLSADAPTDEGIALAAESAPRKPTSLERARLALAESKAPALSNSELCTKIVEVARSNDLPLGFFTNLIWRESRFDHDAISPVGAMGIAQFMPDVAEKMSVDAFDSRSALPASARLLRTLRARFGNLGLAAAAYNAGPKRVSDWLERRSNLPKETQDYVHIITGRPAVHWVKPQTVVYRVPRYVPCHRLPNFVSAEQTERAQQEQIVAEDTRRAELARIAEAKVREAARREVKAKTKVAARSARLKIAARVQESKTVANAQPPKIRLAQVRR